MFEEKKQQYREFCEWQKVPHHVKPMSDDAHVCPTCGRHYVGNFCPQCGQSSKIGRYSFKNALLLYLDVWGLGNRGMFRTIRDLFLRPGYMIRDYLSGMQMAYFPPFKMLFLLCTLSLLVNTGLNIQGTNNFETRSEQYEKEYQESIEHDVQTMTEKAATSAPKQTAKPGKQAKKADADTALKKMFLDINELETQHGALYNLVMLIPFSILLYFAFRHSPNIPDMRFSEFFVALVYMTNLMTMITIVWDFFCIDPNWQILTTLLLVVPLKQLSGYSYTRCFLTTALALLLSLAFMLIVMGLYVVATILMQR